MRLPVLAVLVLQARAAGRVGISAISAATRSRASALFAIGRASGKAEVGPAAPTLLGCAVTAGRSALLAVMGVEGSVSGPSLRGACRLAEGAITMPVWLSPAVGRATARD